MQNQEPDGKSVGDLLRSLAEIEAQIQERRVPRCVMTTDLSGYTSYVDQHGDLAGRRLVDRTAEVVIPLAESQKGRVLKGLGDGWMILFDDPNRAVQAGIEMQRSLVMQDRPDPATPRLKVALDFGKLLQETDDIFGDVVNVSSRLAGICPGEGILISEAVYEALDPYYRLRCEELADTRIRGKSTASVTYLVHWREDQLAAQSLSEQDRLIIEVRWKGSESEVSIRETAESHPPLTPYLLHPLDLNSIDECSREIIQFVRKVPLEGKSAHAGEHLAELGGRLFSLLLPEEIQKKIRLSKSGFLVLRLDDSCVHLPWELLHDGQDFLCCRFAMGRLTRTSQTVEIVRREPPADKFTLLLLSNPTGDLPSATTEGRDLYNLCRSDPRVEVEWLNGEVISEAIRDRMGQFDVLHYCGHAEYSADNPDESGWILDQGGISAGDLKVFSKAGKPAPLLVFNNACQTGVTASWKGSLSGWSYGFANAFLLAGCSHYVGAFSDLPDLSSKEFAKVFYETIISGHPLGIALLKARQHIRDRQNSRDLTWAQYVLYGAPDSGLFGTPVRTPGAAPPEGASADPAKTTPLVSMGPNDRESLDSGPSLVWKQWRRTGGAVAAALVVLIAISAYLLLYQPGTANAEKIRQTYQLSRRGDSQAASKAFGELAGILDAQTTSALRMILALDHGDVSTAAKWLAGQGGEDATRPLALLVKARVQWSQGHIDQALETLDRVLLDSTAADWQKSEAWRIRGRIAYAKEDYQEARRCYEQAVAGQEEDLLLWVDRGLIHEKEGNTEAASAAYMKALILSPNDSYVISLKEACDDRRKTDQEDHWWTKVQESLQHLETNMAGNPSVQQDLWTSRPLTIALSEPEVRGLPSARLGEEKYFVLQLRKELGRCRHLIVVPKASELSGSLRELEVGTSKLANPEYGTQGGRFLAARFLVEGQVFRIGNNTEVELEVYDTESRPVVAHSSTSTTGEWIQTTSRLATHLAEQLSTKYPLRGRIESITDVIQINVGSLHGVQTGDVFDVYPRETHPLGVGNVEGLAPCGQIEVMNVLEGKSSCKVRESGGMLHAGMRAIRHSEAGV